VTKIRIKIPLNASAYVSSIILALLILSHPFSHNLFFKII